MSAKVRSPDIILTDIEGTTGSISFVKKVLFPYARQAMPGFVESNAARLAPLLDEMRRTEKLPDASAEDLAAELVRWIDQDRKAEPLKTIQGMIWAEGYRSGRFKGHVYPDAEAALRRWAAAGVRLYVYSSGSVAAQKLLFGHSDFGDLTPLFSGWFDLAIGSKLEAISYACIASEIDAAPSAILFLSDNPAEIVAARNAGMDTVTLDRDGVGLDGPGPVARSFDDIELEVAA